MGSYNVDPGRIGLEVFFDMLGIRKLVPSRRILQEESEEICLSLKALQLQSLADLLPRLKNKAALQQLSSESGIAEQTLVILAREARSVLVKPEKLDALGDFPFEYTEVLRSKGIKNTGELWNRTRTESQRTALSSLTGIPPHRLQDMHVRCDLLRIKGVGPVYARIAQHAGIHSVIAFATTTPLDHIRLYENSLKDLGMDSVPLHEEDMQYCLDYAQLIVEYAEGE